MIMLVSMQNEGSAKHTMAMRREIGIHAVRNKK
jgi:hypothetical protein